MPNKISQQLALLCRDSPNCLPPVDPALPSPFTHPGGLQLVCDRKQDYILWIDAEVFTEPDGTIYGDIFSIWV